ncbi:MAG: dipeptidase [Clostridia bacterium]|nr:dipeptidase [Clostridia bacterium]
MFADAHCDTITRILDNNQSLFENDGHIDIKRMKDCCLQYFAIFIHPKYNPFDRFVKGINKFYEEYDEKYLQLVLNADDLGQKTGALLTIEGGSAIEGSIQKLHYAYEKGIRCMTIKWNGDNELANEYGLTPFGKTVIKEMNRMKMIVDVSHLSDKGFYDVMGITDAPLMASHSNCRKLCSHKRNLTDDQIKKIIDCKGFIGLNFYPDFLCEGKATVVDIIRHAYHILELGGEDVLGFGSDFDGVDHLPNGILGVQNMNNVMDEFCKMQLGQELLNKVFYRNLCNFTKQIMKN